jgi:hypothetical protein
MRTWRSKPASTRVSSPTSLRGNSRGNRRYLLMRRHRYIARSTLRQIHLRLASELRCYLFAHVCARSLTLRYCDVMIKPSQIFEKTFPCWLTRSLLDNAPRWCLYLVCLRVCPLYNWTTNSFFPINRRIISPCSRVTGIERRVRANAQRGVYVRSLCSVNDASSHSTLEHVTHSRRPCVQEEACICFACTVNDFEIAIDWASVLWPPVHTSDVCLLADPRACIIIFRDPENYYSRPLLPLAPTPLPPPPALRARIPYPSQSVRSERI